jgi:hypothetical protein
MKVPTRKLFLSGKRSRKKQFKAENVRKREKNWFNSDSKSQFGFVDSQRHPSTNLSKSF